MRSIWKGSISFGLVSIGVKLYTATEERDVSFHQVRRTDGSRIRYKRVAEADGEEVAYADIAKGYQLPSGETVVLTDEDFADLPLPSARVVDVLQFVPPEQIDPIYFAKSYYLEPEKNAVKPYVLLRDALDASGQVGLVKVAIRSREQLATLRVRDGVIVMETMIWPDEVREPAFGFLDERRRPAPAGAVDGRVAGREHVRRLRPVRVHRRLPRCAAAGDRRQGRGPRGRRDRGAAAQCRQRRRPDVGAAGVGRGRQAGPVGCGRQDGERDGVGARAGKKAAKKPAKKAAAKKAPAKKAAAKKAPAKKARGQEGAGQEDRRPRRRRRRRPRQEEHCSQVGLSASA